MHILLATTGYPPDHSGAGGRLHRMYTRLAGADASLSWTVITKTRGRDSARIDGPLGVRAFGRGGDEFPPMLEAVSETAWAIKQLRSGLLDGVDLVHSAGWSWTVLPLILAARRRRIPVVRELTTPSEAGSRSVGGRLIAWSNRQAAEVVAISPALAEGARRVAPVTPTWCRPNGVDTARFRAPGPELRAAARAELGAMLPGLAAGGVLILHIGRIRPLKNQLLLADAVAQLPPRFHLLLAGPGYRSDDGYVQALRRRLGEPDLAQRAALIEDNVQGVERLMQAADIFAFPSTQEGLGTVMIEALCCGLPVVASRLPGVTDWVIRDGDNGFLTSLDRAMLAERLAAAEGLLSRRARIAADAATAYDQSAMDEGYRLLFRRVLARGR